MVEHALPQLSFWKFPRVTWEVFGLRRSPKSLSIDEQEDSRSRREFVLEMLDRNADAFHSELDIQHLARLYRSKF